MAKSNSKSGLRQISETENPSFIRDVEKERSDVLALPDNKKSLFLFRANFLSKEDARTAWQNGTIGTKVNEYFDLLRTNGFVPDKPTTTDNSGGARNGNDRVESIMRIMNISRDEAERIQSEFDKWFGGSQERASTADLDRFIDASPAYAGTIYRGMRMRTDADYQNFANGLKVGSTIRNFDPVHPDKATNSSWTHSEEMATHYAGRDPSRSIMLVDVSSKRTSAPVAFQSTQGEEEVLARSTTQWTVLRKEMKGDRLYVYVIEKGK